MEPLTPRRTSRGDPEADDADDGGGAAESFAAAQEAERLEREEREAYLKDLANLIIYAGYNEEEEMSKLTEEDQTFLNEELERLRSGSAAQDDLVQQLPDPSELLPDAAEFILPSL